MQFSVSIKVIKTVTEVQVVVHIDIKNVQAVKKNSDNTKIANRPLFQKTVLYSTLFDIVHY